MNAEEKYEAQQTRDHAPFQRWQHGAIYATADGTQHVASTVAALRKSGKIGDAEVAAAARFYADFAFASGARDPEKSGSGGGVDGYNISQIDAISRGRAAADALSPWYIALLVSVIVEEVSLRRLATAAHGGARAYVGRQVVAALSALSDHYAKRDGSRPGRASPIRAACVGQGTT